jgi:alkylated DNA repair dioxygenase AlkB
METGLLSVHSHLMDTEEILLLNDEFGRVAYREATLPSTLTQDLALPWVPERVKTRFGKLRDAPRLTLAYGDVGVSYSYAGKTQVARPWPPHLLAKKQRVEELTGARFNYALGNLYPDGEACIGWHPDSVKDLQPDSIIASTSDGTTRDFQFKVYSGRVKKARFAVALKQGTLLTMDLRTQAHYKHALPRRKKVKSPRVNWTFRLVKTKK